MTTYQMVSTKTNTRLSTVKTVSRIMGLTNNRITTPQLHRLETALNEIAEYRDNIIYMLEIPAGHAEEMAVNDWYENEEMKKAGMKL